MQCVAQQRMQLQAASRRPSVVQLQRERDTCQAAAFQAAAHPAASAWSARCSLEVKKGQPLTFAVTGTKASDFGPVKLGLELSLPGSSFALANYIGSKASMIANSNTKGYPSTYASQCNARKPDGPDMVRRVALLPQGTCWRKLMHACNEPAMQPWALSAEALPVFSTSY